MRCAQPAVRMGQDPSLHYCPKKGFFGIVSTGGIYAAPTSQPINLLFPYGRGRGLPRPYRAIPYYNNVGRGDPTPPRKFAAGAGLPGRAMLAPTDQPVMLLLHITTRKRFLTSQSAEANASALFAVIRFFGTPESGTRSRWSRCRRRQGVRCRRQGCSSNRGSSQTWLADPHPAR